MPPIASRSTASPSVRSVENETFPARSRRWNTRTMGPTRAEHVRRTGERNDMVLIRCARHRCTRLAVSGGRWCAGCRERQRATLARRRNIRVTAGLCNDCGKESDKGTLRCADCRERRRHRRIEHLCALQCTVCGRGLPNVRRRMCARCRLKGRVHQRDQAARTVRRPELIIPISDARWRQLT